GGVDRGQAGPRRLVARRARADPAALFVVLARDRSAEAEERALAVDARAIVIRGDRGIEAVGFFPFDLLHPADERAILSVDEHHAGLGVHRRAAPVHSAGAA